MKEKENKLERTWDFIHLKAILFSTRELWCMKENEKENKRCRNVRVLAGK